MSSAPRACLLFVALGLSHHAGADVLRVNPSAPNGGNGSSWGRAFQSLDAALASSRPGDEIWVRQGTYVPRTPNSRDATFSVPGGVQVYGGFAGNETSRNQRDPSDNRTVLSGNDVSYTVVTPTGNGVVIDGFEIVEGRADGSGAIPRSRGAGIYASGVSITVRDTVFSDHRSTNDGAAVTILGTAALASTFENCVFEGANGSWTFETTNSLTMVGCVFDNNSAGGLHLRGSGVYSVTDSEFIDQGGQSPIIINTDPGAFSEIDRCTFYDNTCSVAGAVWYNSEGQHEFRSSSVRGNEGTTLSQASGGITDIRTSGSSGLLIENVVFTGNSGGQGAAIRNDGSGAMTITGSTLTGNTSAGATGGGVSVTGTGPVAINNTIIHGNIVNGNLNDERESVFVALGSSVSSNWSLIEFLGGAVGNIGPIQSAITADPQFVDADGSDNTFGTADDNVRLSPGSPAIDRGNNLFVGPFVFADFYGQPRFQDDSGTPDTGNAGGIGAIVDIGAAEFQGTTPGEDCPADVNGDGLVTPQDFTSWVLAYNTRSPACDQNGDGLCTPQDFTSWVLNFNSGC